MPDTYVLKRRFGAVLALAACLVAGSATAASAANDTVVDLRVVTPGETLVDGVSVVTGSTRIKTSSKAKCFIGGAGGSGAVVPIPNPTAFGSVIDAASWAGDLDPIQVTDEFGFGLGICKIGGFSGNAARYWSYTVNHEDPGIGGDQAQVETGDTVMWYLTEFPPPPELEVLAPARTDFDSFEVTVVAHSCVTESTPPYTTTCSSDPVEGASVTGAGDAILTGADGIATLSADAAGRLMLRATLADHIRSAPARVCVAELIADCPAVRGKVIVGRPRADQFAGTGGDDRLLGRAGDDVIRAWQGGEDAILCGPGRDRVVLDQGDGDDELAGCERVVRR